MKQNGASNSDAPFCFDTFNVSIAMIADYPANSVADRGTDDDATNCARGYATTM